MGSNVADEDLKSGVENIYNFEMELAKVCFSSRVEPHLHVLSDRQFNKHVIMLPIVQFPQISTPEDQRRNATELYNPFTLKELKESYDVSLGLVV